jgi:folate-binding protein YgfZ
MIPMTQTDQSATFQTTPLATLLATRIQFELAEYRGVLTPRSLDALPAETEALAHGAALHDLGWKRRVAVRGEDRFRWLSGMVTNTINDLFPNSGAWNLVLNAQGRIQGDLTVWRGEEELSPQRRNPAGDLKAGATTADRMSGTPFAGESGLELELEVCQYDKLLAHLNHFIIMDDVELTPMGEETPGEQGSETAIGLTGPLSEEVLKRVGLPTFIHPMQGARVEWNGIDLRILRQWGVVAAHYEFWLPIAGLQKLWSCLRTGGGSAVGCGALEAFRIAEGIPAYGIDIAERDLPQETSQTRALHFNKGCYQGQEIVERIHARGNVHRHLRPLELDGPVPAPGTALTIENGAEAGLITSATQLPLASGPRTFALAMMRAEAEASNQTFTYSTGGHPGTALILATPPAF